MRCLRTDRLFIDNEMGLKGNEFACCTGSQKNGLLLGKLY